VRSDLIAPLVALLCYVLLHWSGIGLDPDSWAAWQAAVSILDGKGYTYFSGNPIHSWPPLYALYLAAWIAVLGPSALTLMISNAALVVLQAGLWMHFARTITSESGRPVSNGAAIVLSVYVGLFVALNEQSVFAHNLVYTILPVFLIVVWRIVSPPSWQPSLRGILCLLALATVLMLSHVSSLAFLAAAAAVIALTKRLSIAALLTGAGLVVVPTAIWLAVQATLDQGGSHHIGFGAGRFGPLFYAAQLFDGPGSLLVPARFGAQFIAIGLVWLAALAVARHPNTGGLRFGIAFVAFAAVTLYAIYNLSWIFSTLSGRLVLFVPLILVCLTYLAAFPVRPRAATAALGVLIIASTYWTASWSARQFTADLPGLGFPDYFVPSAAYISRDYRVGPPVPGPRGLLIPPSPFEEQRGLRN
jgi:hypothetical protein